MGWTKLYLSMITNNWRMIACDRQFAAGADALQSLHRGHLSTQIGRNRAAGRGTADARTALMEGRTRRNQVGARLYRRLPTRSRANCLQRQFSSALLPQPRHMDSTLSATDRPH